MQRFSPIYAFLVYKLELELRLVFLSTTAAILHTGSVSDDAGTSMMDYSEVTVSQE